MKRAGIAFGIAVIFGSLLVYLVLRYSPFDSEKLKLLGDAAVVSDNIEFLLQEGMILPVLDYKMIYFVWGMALVAVTSLIVSIHLLVDKLFYKKFFEQPRLWPAIRRGFLCYLLVFGLLFFRFLASFTFLNVLLVIIMVGTLELLAIKFGGPSH